MTARTDDELVLLARSGLAAAFDTLVRRYQRRVLALAARLVGKWGLAPDIAQETFLQVYRALPDYQPRGRFSAYLCQILVNQCRMARRRKSSEDRGHRALWVAPVEPAVVAEAEYIAREDQCQLQSALAGLNTNLRVVAVLRYGSELSYGEISQRLSLPMGTVKRRLYEATWKLRQTFPA